MPDHPLFIRVGNGAAFQGIHRLESALHSRRHPLQETVVELHSADIERQPDVRHAAQVLAVSFPEFGCGHCDSFLNSRTRRTCSLAASTMRSGMKPNFVCNSFNGAEAPNVFMPIMRPVLPTYRSQPNSDACSTDTRAFSAAGSTSSRYFWNS